MERLSKLPKDLLVKLLIEVNNKENYTDEQLEERIKSDREELEKRKFQRILDKNKEKNEKVKRVLKRLIEILPQFEENRQDFLQVIQEGIEEKWYFILYGRSDFYIYSMTEYSNVKVRIYDHKILKQSYINFFTALKNFSFTGGSSSLYIEIINYFSCHYSYKNVFTSDKDLIYKKCQKCSTYQISNFSMDNDTLLYYDVDGQKRLGYFKESRISDDNLCPHCS